MNNNKNINEMKKLVRVKQRGNNNCTKFKFKKTTLNLHPTYEI